MSLPYTGLNLIAQSFLPDKAKHNYINIVNERINRFNQYKAPNN